MTQFGRIKESYIEDLVNDTDMVELVGRYTDLKKEGKNYVGLCCFHDEKSPSLNVSVTGSFHCFGCEAGGGPTQFVSSMYNLQLFPDVIRKLADLTRYRDVEYEENQNQSSSPRPKPTGLARQALTDSVEVYRAKLGTARDAAQFLVNRNFVAQDINQFEIGYAPDEYHFLTHHFKGIWGRTILVDAGLAATKESSKNYWDRFRGRIMFPVRDHKGNLVGYGGRLITTDKNKEKKLGKYYNSPQSSIYNKSELLYGLYQYLQNPHRERNVINVTEGYIDVISCHRFGFTNTVGTMGTSLSAYHVRLLRRFGADHIRMIFDGDPSGVEAAYRALKTALPTMKSGQSINIVLMPHKEDPDSLLNSPDGPVLFQKRIDRALPGSTFLFEYLKTQHPGNTPESKASALTEARQVIDLISDTDLQTQFSNEAKRQFGDNVDVISPTRHLPKISPEQQKIIDESSPELVRFCGLVLFEPKWLKLESLPENEVLTQNELALVQFTGFTLQQMKKNEVSLRDVYSQDEAVNFVQYLSALTPSELTQQIEAMSKYKEWKPPHIDHSTQPTQGTSLTA